MNVDCRMSTYCVLHFSRIGPDQPVGIIFDQQTKEIRKKTMTTTHKQRKKKTRKKKRRKSPHMRFHSVNNLQIKIVLFLNDTQKGKALSSPLFFTGDESFFCSIANLINKWKLGMLLLPERYYVHLSKLSKSTFDVFLGPHFVKLSLLFMLSFNIFNPL